MSTKAGRLLRALGQTEALAPHSPRPDELTWSQTGRDIEALFSSPEGRRLKVQFEPVGRTQAWLPAVMWDVSILHWVEHRGEWMISLAPTTRPLAVLNSAVAAVTAFLPRHPADGLQFMPISGARWRAFLPIIRKGARTSGVLLAIDSETIYVLPAAYKAQALEAGWTLE